MPDAALKLAQETVIAAPADATALLAQAQLQAGEAPQWAAAIAAYRKVIELQGDALAARQGILGLLIGRRELDAAATELEQLRRQHPQHPATLYFESLLAAHRGDAAAAQGAAGKLLGGAPTQARYGRLAGAVALEAGEPSKAVAQVALAQRANPADPALRRLFALALVREGDPRQALDVLMPQLGAGSTDAEALALAGVAALQLGDRAAARAHFAQAAAHAPADNPRLRATLALGQLAQGEVRGGLESLEALAQADAGLGLDSVLASARIQRGEHEAAAQWLDALQRKRPGDPEVPLLRAELLRRRGDTAGGRATLERALEAAPQQFPTVAALAELDLREPRLPQARARFEALLAQAPRNTDAMLALARIAQLSGAPPQEASRWLAEAVRTEPTKAALRMQQVEHAVRHGQWQAALSAADDAAQALPGDARLQLLLACACLAAREPRRAVAVLGKLSSSPAPGAAGPAAGDAGRGHGPGRASSASARARKSAASAGVSSNGSRSSTATRAPGECGARACCAACTAAASRSCSAAGSRSQRGGSGDSCSTSTPSLAPRPSAVCTATPEAASSASRKPGLSPSGAAVPASRRCASVSSAGALTTKRKSWGTCAASAAYSSGASRR
jgi:putative PEP-CTERM system TPR-repeat lipoprotein